MILKLVKASGFSPQRRQTDGAASGAWIVDHSPVLRDKTVEQLEDGVSERSQFASGH
jgi:hypothetical protein